MLQQYFGFIVLVFGLFQPLYWLYRPEITRCIFLGVGRFNGIGSVYVKRKNKIWLFWSKTVFSFWQFQAIDLTQSLKILPGAQLRVVGVYMV